MYVCILYVYMHVPTYVYVCMYVCMYVQYLQSKLQVVILDSLVTVVS